MKNKIIKKNVRTEKERYDNQVLVILEKMESKFTVFVEVQKLLINKINNFEVDIKNQFMILKERQSLLSNKFNKIDIRIDRA